MGRARALRNAYTEMAAQDAKALPLTTVDVFHWLEDEGLFLRSDINTSNTAESHKQLNPSQSWRKPQQSDDPRSADFCRACGLQRAHHPTPTEESFQPSDVKPSLTPLIALTFGSTPGTSCVSFRDGYDEATCPPVLDITALLRSEPHRAVSVPHGFHPTIYTPQSRLPDNELLSVPVRAQSAALVAVADPRLVVAIGRMTGLPIAHGARSHTDAFADIAHEEAESHSLTPCSLTMTIVSVCGPGGLLAQRRATVETILAPSAALAVAVKAVVRQLVLRGAEAFRQDEAAFRVVKGRHRHERARRDAQRLLTPAHVLAGLARHAPSDVTSAALLLSISKLGKEREGTSSSSSPNGARPHDHRHVEPARGIHLRHRDAGQMTDDGRAGTVREKGCESGLKLAGDGCGD